MREYGPRPTLGELQRSTPWVWLWCERCQHHAPFACAVAVILRGPNAWSDKLRAGARCASCGGKGAAPSASRMGRQSEDDFTSRSIASRYLGGLSRSDLEQSALNLLNLFFYCPFPMKSPVTIMSHEVRQPLFVLSRLTAPWALKPTTSACPALWS